MSAARSKDLESARNALHRGDLAAAERLFRKILRKAPNMPAALHGLGVVALNRRQLLRAEKHFAAAAAGAPGEPAIMADQATVYFYLERMDEAERCYRGALAKIGKHPDLLLGLGLAVKYQHRLDEARAIFAQAAADFPDHIAFPMNLAGLAFDMKDYEASIEYYRQTLKLDQGNPDIWSSLAVW